MNFRVKYFQNVGTKPWLKKRALIILLNLIL